MYSFDLRLSFVPFSLLRITNTFRQMKPGEEMEIVSGASDIDAATIEDIKRILPRTGYDIISNETMDDSGLIIRLRLRKTLTTHHQKGEPSCLKSI
ncbi:MAG: hypothetical protein HGJ94_00445 [Desulfosarcina sp.]|nr:hypothetical protein [Desulfosarcina sp.]MBC2743108.1 hypothetical protein [Desulfosarcina sp.]MBC2766018.1 hypothetical protein [Desulfosarcina sp.]